MNVVRPAVLAWSLWLVASWPAPVAAQEAETFESAAARFSVTKPAGWTVISLDELRLSQEDWQSVDEKTRKALREKLEQLTIPMPLVTMAKEAGSSELAVVVLLLPLPAGSANGSPMKLLEKSFAEKKKLFPDLTLEKPMRERTVSGRRAAEYVARYTLRLDGRAVPMRTAAILVPRGRTIFLIGLVVTQAGEDRHLEEFEKIVASITIGD